MSDPSALSSKLRKQRSRKKYPDKQMMAQDLWPSIRLHGIRILIKLHGSKIPGTRLLNIKPHGIMSHDARLLSVSGLSIDLYLPVIVANPRPTNPSPLKGRRRWKMINTAESHLFGCKAWWSGWVNIW